MPKPALRRYSNSSVSSHCNRLIALPILISFAAGCSNVNVSFNDLGQPVERFKANDVDRAEGFFDVAPLPQRDPAPAEPTSRPVARPPAAGDYFVGVAISGGGSRSANFSAACLFQLQRLGILRRVNCISAVSGGSLTAAYYCSAPDDRWTIKDAQEKLTHPFATDLIASLLLPWNAAAVLISDYDRSDILAEKFQDVLFSRGGRGLTFNDLRPDRPRLLINATDLQSGHRFVFCNSQFDQINSDLSVYPLAWAVAASSAVPVALHPVTLRDFSTTFPQYRHLIDGGIYDNLGVTSLVDSYEGLTRGKPGQFPNGAVMIVIDAGTQFDDRLSDLSDVGLLQSARAGIGLTSTALLNRAGRATLSDLIVMHSPATRPAEDIRRDIRTFQKEHVVRVLDRRNKPVWIVHLSLAQVGELSNLPYESFGSSVNDISTYFNIAPTEAYSLYKAAEVLFRQRFDEKFAEIEAQLERPG